MNFTPKSALQSGSQFRSVAQTCARPLTLRSFAPRLLAFGLFLALALGHANCSAIAKRQALENCKFDLETVEILQAGLAGIELRFLVAIENPNPGDVVVDRLDFELFTGGKKVGQGVHKDRIDIPPAGKETIALDVKASAAELGFALLSAITSQSGVDYRVEGTAYVATLFGEFPYPFTVEETIQ